MRNEDPGKPWIGCARIVCLIFWGALAWWLL